MYEYQYVNVVLEGLFACKLEEHRPIIDRYAAEGWRYVGYIPTHTTNNGALCNIDLIFEREKEEK